MLNKDKILDHLRELTNRHRVSRKELQVLGPAALVLHGVKAYANVIDIHLNFETCERLLEEGRFEQQETEKEAKIWIKNEIFNIRNDWHPAIMSRDGFMVQTHTSLVTTLGAQCREEDASEIERMRLALGQY